MADLLDHATWFFDSAWGDGITGIIVPIAAAASAAWLVLVQVRKADRFRVSDRRTEGVQVLSGMFIDTAALVLEEDPVTPEQVFRHRFRTNENVVRAYGLLENEDRAVPAWAAVQIVILGAQVKDVADLEAAEPVRLAEEIKRRKNAVTKVAAECIQMLVSWQADELETEWFHANKGTIDENSGDTVSRLASPDDFGKTA